jgi:hypothetical protein
MTESSGLVVAMWLIVLLAAAPLAVVLERSIRADIGPSLIHRELRGGLDLGWLEEFHHRAPALAKTLKPVRVSPAMAFANVDLWINGSWATGDRALVAAAGIFLLVWILAQGGILTHLASPDLRFAWSSFLAAGGTYFFRFLRLAAVTGVAYYGVYRLAFRIFPAIDRWTRDVTSESRVLALHLAGLAAVALLMAMVHLIADYARVATVREKRRSMLLALARGAMLVGRHPLTTLTVFATMMLLLGAVQVLYFWLAPAVGGASPVAVLLALLVGQLYILVRWALRIARYGAELSLFDSWSTPRQGSKSQS